jgi:hypothetical protein
MANANTTIDLDTLHDAIEAAIKTKFPALKTVEFYSSTRSGMTYPACLLELCEIEAYSDPDPGTEQQAVMARFEARLIIPGVDTTAAKRSIRKLAAAFSAFIRLKRWPDPNVPGKAVPTGPAELIGAYHDDFHPELDQFEVWRVEWQQILHLGDTVWTDEGTTPSHVLVSFSPAIGTPHTADYKDLTP